jgi:hypothetical protein
MSALFGSLPVHLPLVAGSLCEQNFAWSGGIVLVVDPGLPFSLGCKKMLFCERGLQEVGVILAVAKVPKTCILGIGSWIGGPQEWHALVVDP